MLQTASYYFTKKVRYQLGRTTHNSKVTHGELSRYSFTWAWFATDYDELFFLLSVIIINPYVLVKVM